MSMHYAPVYMSILAFSTLAVSAPGGIVAFEATSFPEVEDETWVPTPFCDPDQWIEDGWMYAQLEVACGGPPDGDTVRYVRTLPEFVGEERLFFEWRVETDGDRSDIPGMAPTTMVMGGTTPASYNFVISRDLVKFYRDTFVDYTYFWVVPGVPHTYRIEVYGVSEYRIYIDGEVVLEGVPDFWFPGLPADVVVFRAKPWYLPHTTRWDYVRLGTIPVDGSGDYDSNDVFDEFDAYYFREYFSGSDVDAGPGGRFADLGFDGDVDCRDWNSFVQLWFESAGGFPDWSEWPEQCQLLTPDGSDSPADDFVAEKTVRPPSGPPVPGQRRPPPPPLDPE